MTANSNEILTSDEKGDFRAYALHRSRCVEEDSLINHRMGWMLWSASILLALWGALTAASVAEKIIAEGYRLALSTTAVIVSAIGFTIAWQSMIAVSAARTEVERIRDVYITYVKDRSLKYTILKTVTGEDLKHYNGHRSAKWMPIFFIILWVLLCLCSFANSIINLLRAAGKVTP